MRETFMTHILAADRKFYEGPLESLIMPTNEGQYGILAKHRNVITATVPGVLKYKLPNEEFKTAAVSSGLVKVENGEVLILVDSCERPEEIDVNRAKKAEARAKEEMLQKKSIQEYQNAKLHLARAINRLKVKKRS